MKASRANGSPKSRTRTLSQLRSEFRLSLFALIASAGVSFYTVYSSIRSGLPDPTFASESQYSSRYDGNVMLSPILLVCPLIALCNAIWCLRTHRSIRRATSPPSLVS